MSGGRLERRIGGVCSAKVSNAAMADVNPADIAKSNMDER